MSKITGSPAVEKIKSDTEGLIAAARREGAEAERNRILAIVDTDQAKTSSDLALIFHLRGFIEVQS